MYSNPTHKKNIVDIPHCSDVTGPNPFLDARDGNIMNIRVDSGKGEGEEVCAIVSVQKPGGPVWDDEARIRDDNFCEPLL